ncbi:MAG: membrane dipeptidase [Alphaproteobacteria bacterium]|nr:membrane dipeptidase [Alphaproteobacteria bacterium]
MAGEAAAADAAASRAAALHAQALVIDACAPILRDAELSEHWIAGGANAALASLALHDDDRLSTIAAIGRLYRLVRARPDRVVARDAAAIRRAKAEGRFAIVLAFQNSGALGRDINMVELYHQLGVRVMNLAYNQAEAAADGCTEPRNGGLTLFGRQVIAEMNRVGMLLDLSHTGHRSSMEAIALSAAPVAFTHSNAKAVFDHPRNLADDQIAACAKAGGVIGLNGHPAFVRAGTAAPSFEDLLAHLDHLVDRAGIDHVGIGLDFSQAPGQQMTPARYAKLMAEGIFTPETLPPPPWSYPVPEPRCIGMITERLLARGWREADLRKLLGGNFLRLFEKVWGGNGA